MNRKTFLSYMANHDNIVLKAIWGSQGYYSKLNLKVGMNFHLQDICGQWHPWNKYLTAGVLPLYLLPYQLVEI